MKKLLSACVFITVLSNSVSAQSWLLNGNSEGSLKTIGTADNNDLPFITNNLERMRLSTNGNLGIATNSPLSLIHVVKTGIGASQSESNGLLLQNTTAATSTVMQASPPIVFSGNGWKSNATAESQPIKYMLDVLPSVNTATTGGIFRIQRSVNNAAFAEVFSVGNLSNNPGINFKLNNNNVMYTGGGMNIFYSSSSGIGFYNQAGTVSNMFMTNGGQLIIGGNQLTPEASAWLDIKGTSGVYKGFLTPRMTTAQRNGIASPATGLEIYNTETNTKDIYNGTAWVSLASTASITTPTLQQVTSAGSTTTDVVTAGGIISTTDATVNGIKIGRGNSSIGTNTAVGENSLFANTTGINNTALGKGTLANNTTGNTNTALGTQALELNTTTSGNTAIGAGALTNNIANSNTAVGASALYNNTTGTYNVVLGGSALFSNTTGSNNAALGYWALRYNTTGNENTSFGTTALRENTTGNRNVGLGRMALYLNTTGSNKIGIGYQAGYNNNGDGSVFIGYQAGYNETGSNKLYIANSSTTTPLIGGDFSTGMVGIGTASPEEKLEVTGNIKATGSIITSGFTMPATGLADGMVLTSNGTAGAAEWRPLPAADNVSWVLNGNTIASGQYFGTKNNQPVVFKTNSDADASAKAVILANGNIGIATETPEYKLDIAPAYTDFFTAARLKGDLIMWEKEGAADKDSRGIHFRGYGHLEPYPLQTASIFLDAYGSAATGSMLQLTSSGGIRLQGQDGYYLMTPKSSTGQTKLYSQGGEFIIGTNSVSSGIKLANGYVQTSGNLFQLSNTTTNVITVPAATHNVGIGTENPSAQLHTTGTVRFAGLTSSAGTRYLVSDNDGNIGYTTTGGGNGNAFWTSNSNNISNTNDGWVSIGTSSAAASDPVGNFKLYVEGGIRARKVKVDQSTWPDYVFEKEYQLPRLSDVDLFIKNNKHLPGIKSAAEINKEGLDLGENQAALLQKIEELTLYIIEQDKKIAEQNKTATEQKLQISQFQKQLDELKQLVSQKR